MSALRTPGHRLALGVAFGVLLAGAFVGGSPATGAAPIGPHVSPCTGAPASTGLAGTFTVEGGPLPANATAGVNLTVTFDSLQSDYVRSSGEFLSAACASVEETVTSAGNGTFSATLTPPANDCGGTGSTVCSSDVGVYGPVSVSPAVSSPPGYRTSVTRPNGTSRVAWVADLASLDLTPSVSTPAFSSGAPTTFVATAEMGNGSATPVVPEFAWSLNAPGWAIATTNGSATVTAEPGAAPAQLHVLASIPVGPFGNESAAATANLTAFATTVASGELTSTALDAGGSVNGTLRAVGAAGYSYRATFLPGLGLDPVSSRCASTPGPAGAVDLTCAANLTYPDAGTAQPTANVSNGFSTGSWTFPAVTVAPPPALSLTPSAPDAYTGAAFPVDLTVASGTGVGPYAEACLDDGVGVTVCQSGPGPSWRFTPSYATPGAYRLEAWAIDADGTNRSVSLTCPVVAPPRVASLDVTTPSPSAGGLVDLMGTLSGGALPLHYWWNLSGVNESTVSGVANSDGPVSLDFVPAAAGVIEVSLAVADALGTPGETSIAFVVAPAPVAEVETTSALPSNPVVVGTAIPLSWESVDRAGAAVLNFSTPALLELRNADGAAVAGWVNSTALGPLSAVGAGEFGVPASAWVGGALRLTVAAGVAGGLWVSLAGAGLPNLPAAVPVDVAPDLDHLALYAPVVVQPGTRSNSTFWLVHDHFGDPVPGAEITVETRSAVGVVERVRPAVLVNGTTGVWVNYSAPDAGAATVLVLDSAGEVLLGPIAVPALAGAYAPSPSEIAVAAAVPAGAVGVVLSAVVRRRRRPDPDGEASLQRFAEGEGQVTALLRRLGESDLAGLEAAWDPPPAPSELADWVAALVADGTLTASMGDDRVARFRIAPSGPPSAQVTVDPSLLDAALARRDADLEETDEGAA